MEKLIELLNEYEVEKKPSRLQRNYYLWFVHNFWKWIMYIDEEWEDVDDYRTDYEIISKEYGFIKWLVDNDKIDDELKYNNLYRAIEKDFNKDDRIIMLLSIQDNPIEFLISILK
jgi:hypothetical protein